MRFYHVSENGNIKEFTPRVPWCINRYEDCVTDRICITESIEHSLSGAPIDEVMFGDRYYVYEFEIDIEKDYNDIIMPIELYMMDKVPDSIFTHEHWYLKPLKPISVSYIQINSFDKAYFHNERYPDMDSFIYENVEFSVLERKELI